MKPRICLVGGNLIMNLAKKILTEFKDEAEFLLIPGLLDQVVPKLREVEGKVDIVLAGPSTRRICVKELKVPVIAFKPTFPDMIRAIQEAQRIDRRIAICLSRDDVDFDIPLLSEVMNTFIQPFYCDSIEEYRNACIRAKEEGYWVIIGGSFTVSAAKEIGLRGILLYKGMDMIRTAVKNAIEICRIQREEIRRVSQLSALVNNFTEGLLLTDENGTVIFDNPTARLLLRKENLQGSVLYDLLGSKNYLEVLQRGEKLLNVVERENLVASYIPVRSSGAIHGVVCILREVDEIQNVEFAIRKKLHDRGFVSKYNLNDIIGESAAIRSCKEMALRFANVDDPILITGESGTGKELFAHSLHSLSPRAKGPFVAINCATLPSELLESELFGYEKGAFTGAHTGGKKGLIELAHGGTLFLDEITSLNYSLQAKLLRLLSEREIIKLGSERIIPVNIRIIAATNENIESLVHDRRFREDLYYRLNTFRLHIPPLRERPEDLVPLFLHFVRKFREDILSTVFRRRNLIQKVLLKERFPGNVRELENIAKRFCLLFDSEKGSKEIEHLIQTCLERRVLNEEETQLSLKLKPTIQQLEKKFLEELLKRYKNKTELSRILDIDRSSLWRKLKKYGIQ